MDVIQVQPKSAAWAVLLTVKTEDLLKHKDFCRDGVSIMPWHSRLRVKAFLPLLEAIIIDDEDVFMICYRLGAAWPRKGLKLISDCSSAVVDLFKPRKHTTTADEQSEQVSNFDNSLCLHDADIRCPESLCWVTQSVDLLGIKHQSNQPCSNAVPLCPPDFQICKHSVRLPAVLSEQ